MKPTPTLRAHRIRKGQHRPDGAWCRALSGLYLSAPEAFVLQVMFTPSCWYKVTPGVNDQLQKLGGYSRGWHHQNSTRLVWCPTQVRPYFDVLLYEYRDGVRPSNEACEHLATVKACELATLPEVHLTDRGPRWGYRLGPHFEGPNQTGAPHEMVLYTALRPIR